MSIKKICNCEIRDCKLTPYLCNENDAKKIVTGGDLFLVCPPFFLAGQKAFNMC